MPQAKSKKHRAGARSRAQRPKRRTKKQRRSNQHALSRAIVKRDVVTPTLIRQARERELTQAEIDLVHRTVAKGTSPDQFALFLWHCRKHGFDPVAKEVYCVLFNVTKHHQDFDCPGPTLCLQPQGTTGIWHKGKEMVILTGIGGLRGAAARNHEDYGSVDEPQFTFSGDKRTPAGKLIPDSCTVRVWKKGATRPTSATLYWEEFAPFNLSDERFEFWNKMPKNQLAKCTEAQAQRKAYPDLVNIYVTEEFARKFSETTAEGREMTVTHRLPQAVQDARAALRDAKSPEEAKKAQEAFTKTRAPQQPPPPPAAAAPVPAAPLPGGPTLMGTIVVNKDFTVTGDLADVSPELQKLLLIRWENEFWHIYPKDLPELAKFCRERRYGLVAPAGSPAGAVSVSPARSQSSPEGMGPSPPARSQGKRGGSGGGSAPTPVLVCGVIDRVTREPRGNKVLGIVTLVVDKKHPAYSCWDKDVTDILAGKIGQLAEVWTRTKGQFRNIIGLQKVAGVTYTDGKIPDIQKDREPGKTLWG